MAARWPAGPEPMTNKSYVYSGTSSCPFGAYHAPCVSVGEDVSTAVFEDTELGRAQRLQSVGVVQPWHADHLAEPQTGERCLHHVLRSQGCDWHTRQVNTLDGVELRLHCAGTQDLNVHAGIVQLVGEDLGERDQMRFGGRVRSTEWHWRRR